MIKIAPSILSANFARLEEQISETGRAGADRIHIDVMDGHFAPNLSMGPVVVKGLRPVTHLPLEVHLMIEAPERYLADFAKAGADCLIVHQEATVHLHRTIQVIRELGKSPGVAINPATPPQVLQEILLYLDLVLIMTVNPGFSGQPFIETTLSKIERVCQMRERQGVDFELEVDGGINCHTAPTVAAAGAQVLVAGSAVFGTGIPVTAALQRLQACARQGKYNIGK